MSEEIRPVPEVPPAREAIEFSPDLSQPDRAWAQRIAELVGSEKPPRLKFESGMTFSYGVKSILSVSPDGLVVFEGTINPDDLKRGKDIRTYEFHVSRMLYMEHGED